MGRGVTWTRLDDAMGEHRKTRRLLRVAGLGTFGLHTLAILHSSRYLTDGFVERDYVEETFDLSKTRTRDGERLLSALCEQGLWVPTDGGWTLHDYLDHNPSRSQVEERRRADSERKARGRNGASTQSPTGSQAESDRPTPTPVLSQTPPTPPKGGRRREKTLYRERLVAYATALLPEVPTTTAIRMVEQAAAAGAQTGNEVITWVVDHRDAWAPPALRSVPSEERVA